MKNGEITISFGGEPGDKTRGVFERFFVEPDLTQPTIENLFKLIKRAHKKGIKGDFVSNFGDLLEVCPITLTHSIGDYSYSSDGLLIKTKQLLPQLPGEKDITRYLSVIFEWDKSEQGRMHVSTCVSVPDNKMDSGYRRIGDLRVNYLYFSKLKGGQFSEGVVDGNDDGFGIPTGEGYIRGLSYLRALERAYALFTTSVFGIGDLQNLGAKSNTEQQNPVILLPAKSD